MTAPHSTALKAARRGQAILEMALVISVLMVLTMGIVQFALLANARVTLSNLTREGARYAAVHALDADINGVTTDSKIKAYVVQTAKFTSLSSITAADVTISPVQGDTERTSGKGITLTVRYDMTKKFFLPVMFPGLSNFSKNTAATSIMVIE